MASSEGSSMQMRNVMECSLCLQTFTDPKGLPCMHTFCLHCLQQYCGDKNPGTQVPCPICRKLFLVPKKGIQEIPTNFIVSQMLIAMAASTSLGETKKYNKLQNCKHHPDRNVKVYCFDCKIAICALCHGSKHAAHKCTDVQTAREEVREQIRNYIRDVSVISKGLQERLDKFDVDNEIFVGKISTTERQISAKRDQLVSLIESQQSELIAELNLFKDERLMQMERDKDIVVSEFVKRESFVLYCQGIVDNGTECDIFRDTGHLQTTADELLKTVEVGKDWSESDVSFFTPSTNHNLVNLIGELSLKGFLSIFYLIIM